MWITQIGRSAHHGTPRADINVNDSSGGGVIGPAASPCADFGNLDTATTRDGAEATTNGPRRAQGGKFEMVAIKNKGAAEPQVLGFVCPGSYTHTQTVESQSPLGVISAGDASHAQTGGTPVGVQVTHVRTGELP